VSQALESRRWDEQELDRLQGDGIRLIQLHEEWNDMLRRHGGDKYAPVNPGGSGVSWTWFTGAG